MRGCRPASWPSAGRSGHTQKATASLAPLQHEGHARSDFQRPVWLQAQVPGQRCGLRHDVTDGEPRARLRDGQLHAGPGQPLQVVDEAAAQPTPATPAPAPPCRGGPQAGVTGDAGDTWPASGGVLSFHVILRFLYCLASHASLGASVSFSPVFSSEVFSFCFRFPVPLPETHRL